MAKTRFNDTELADSIISRIRFEPIISRISSTFEREFAEKSRKSSELAHEIIEPRRIETGQQPEKISDAMEEVREQIMIRDQHKPDYFIWELKLIEDAEEFGFLRTIQKNKLTKFVQDFSFKSVSNQFKEYFSSRIEVSSTDISSFSRKKV
ncbi:MAG: hypothetical protein GF404_13260 [candidate division Zixibacteria bacterium]|nr:hypothetical protein [candidate division Zixibacteria bacterium]